MKCLLLPFAIALTASTAQAQDTVVVTGQRDLEDRAEVAGRLDLTQRETPATLDVITQDAMQAQGLRTAIEALNAAPGVVAGNLPGSIGAVSMRGFTRAVNYLYDGVRMAGSDVGVRNWDAWMFERIEIIKGPASVTSGDGALAGAINFVPRRPVLGQASGEMLAGYGSFASARLAADVNVPIGATVAIRGDAAWSRTSGWVDDTDGHTLATAVSLLWQPTPRLTVTLSADYAGDRQSSFYYGTPVVPRAVAREPSDAVTGDGGLVLDRAMARVNFDTLDGRGASDAVWLRARARYAVSDAATLTSDTSWYDGTRLWRDGDEYTYNAATQRIDRSATLITHDHRFWNQRLDLSVDTLLAGLRNRFVIGGEIGTTDFFTQRRFGTLPSVDRFAPDRGLFPADTPANFATRQDVTADVHQVALFAEDALNLTPDWLVVGGLRYDRITLDRSVLNVTSGATQAYGQRYDPVTWRVGSVYSLTPRTQVFVQYTRAVTPVSGLLFLSAANARFDLTTGRSYEAGVKTSLSGTGVELTASLFDIRQDDIVTRDPANPAVSIQGGSLRSRGVEVALNLPVTPELAVAASGTVLDAGYLVLIEAGGADRAGKRPPNVPTRTADVTVTYMPRSVPLMISAGVRHTGDMFTANANMVRIAPVTTLEAAIAWRTDAGTLTLRGRNLTDAVYADWSGYAPGLVFVGAPRSVDLVFTRRF